MINPKYGELVYKLLEKTDNGKLKWEKTEEQGIYQTTLLPMSIRIWSQDSDCPEGFDVLFSLFDEQGELIDSFSDVEFKKLNENNEYETTYKLYAYAKNSALGSIELLNKTLEDLDKL